METISICINTCYCSINPFPVILHSQPKAVPSIIPMSYQITSVAPTLPSFLIATRVAAHHLRQEGVSAAKRVQLPRVTLGKFGSLDQKGWHTDQN